MPLARLIYVSTAVDHLRPHAIGDILRTARLRNAQDGITGLLMLAERHFMQMLEGPEAMVSTMFEDIRHDPRHRDVMIIHTCTESKRQFPDWSMGFAHRDVPKPHSLLPETVLEEVTLDAILPASVAPDVRTLFTSFRASDAVVRATFRAPLLSFSAE